MIRYLEQEEKERTRDLWEEAFSEDSSSFVDYYYKEKMKDNRVLVFEREGQIVSMLHRNPYRIWLRGAECSCDYLVGISTAVAERGKGRMRSLILSVLRDMQEAGAKTEFLEDGSIKKTLASGNVVTTTFLLDGSIKETTTDSDGNVLITKTTTFGSDGSITTNIVYNGEEQEENVT